MLSQYIKLNQKNFNYNVNNIKKRLANKSIIAVVKSNAYGHGMLEIAKFADQNKNIDVIATHNLSEAIYLRKFIDKKILVLSHIDTNPEIAKNLNISLVVYNFNQLQDALIHDYNFHLKFNTGLNRLGFNESDTEKVIEFLQKNNLKPEGIFSHFAESESADTSFTIKQINLFNNVIEKFIKTDILPKFIHLTNSTGFLRSLDSKYTNSIRSCGALLGLKKELYSQEFTIDLKPVLSWYAPILQIRDIEPEDAVGYGRTFIAKSKKKIGIVAAGYCDGYARELSNCGYIGIDNNIVPIIGKICMNMLMIDLTNILAREGDFVELVGPNISFEKLAKISKLPIYSLACFINNQINRSIEEDLTQCYTKKNIKEKINYDFS